MNLVIQEKGKEPFINEVLGVERRPGDSRGQKLLRWFVDSPGAPLQPGIGAKAARVIGPRGRKASVQQNADHFVSQREACEFWDLGHTGRRQVTCIRENTEKSYRG